MELCCREGPDGGTGPRGKNPRKWFAVPRSRGLPLNGCMPRVAWQQLGTTRSSSRTSTSRHGSGANGRRVRLLLTPAWKQPAAAMDSIVGEEAVELLQALTPEPQSME